VGESAFDVVAVGFDGPQAVCRGPWASLSVTACSCSAVRPEWLRAGGGVVAW
jgi:hypothetical protein